MNNIILKRKGKKYNISVDDKDVHLLNEKMWFVHKSYEGKMYVVRDDYLGLDENKKRIMKRVFLHRTIMNPNSGSDIDHVNGNGLDNRRKNLRVCSRQQNSANRGPLNGREYKGVFKHRKKWLAQIGYNYKRIYLGCFHKKEDAAMAYNKKAVELFGNFAYTNKIKGE